MLWGVLFNVNVGRIMQKWPRTIVHITIRDLDDHPQEIGTMDVLLGHQLGVIEEIIEGMIE